MILARLGERKVAIAWNFLAFLPIAVVINSSKEIINDWGWYTRHFLEKYPSYPLLDIFGNFHPNNQLTEPVYYTLSWTVAQLFPGNVGMLIVMIVAFVYGSLSLATLLMSNGLKLDATNAVLLQYLLFGFGMTFTLVTHLVRQSMAVAVLSLALAFIIQGRLGPATLAVVFATLIHTPAAVLGSIIILAGYVYKTQKALPLFAYFLIGIPAGFFWWIVYGERYGGSGDGGVSLFMVALDLSILIGLAFQASFFRPKNQSPQFLVAAVLLLHLGFIAGHIFEPLPALRFYLYLTPTFATGAFLILRFFSARRLSGPAQLTTVGALGLATVLSMSLRIASSPFQFEQDFLRLAWLWPGL